MTQRTARQKIKRVTDKIIKEYQPKKIILFGTYAWGKPNKYSDIDLLIVKVSKKNMLERSREIYRIIFDEGEAADALVYTPSQLEKRARMGDPFVRKIVKSGKVLYAAK